MVDGFFKPRIFVECNRNLSNLKSLHLHIFDLQHIRVGQDRIFDFKHLAVLRLLFQKITLYAHIHGLGCDDLFPDGVNRRIGNLCKELFKVIKQWLVPV